MTGTAGACDRDEVKHSFDGRENFAGFVLLPDPDNDNPSDDRDGYVRGDDDSALQGIRSDTRSFDLRIVLIESCFSNRLLYRSRSHETRMNKAPDNFRKYFGAWAYVGLTSWAYSEHDRRAWFLLHNLDLGNTMTQACENANSVPYPYWPIHMDLALLGTASFDGGRNNRFPLYWPAFAEGYSEGSIVWDQNPSAELPPIAVGDYYPY